MRRESPVAGAAALEVVVHAPALVSTTTATSVSKSLAKPRLGLRHSRGADRLAQLAAGPLRLLLRRPTTIAVGLGARVPFRVFALPDTRNQIVRVVLDVAH
jgi:hypothetical protein